MLKSAIGQLKIASETPAGYGRALFKDWVDADKRLPKHACGSRGARVVSRGVRMHENGYRSIPARATASSDTYVGPLVKVKGLALPFTLGDVNNDGKPDIIGIKGNNMVTYLNKSSR